MPRNPKSPGVIAYYDTLRQLFELQSRVLSGALPHHGERGANDELRVREFLAKTLPRKFSVGTGFVVCSNPSFPHSAQTDIVVFDEIQNSPLHRELAADVYPIEMVYATVEVKAMLRPKDLGKTLKDIATIRAMASQRWYSRYVAAPPNPARPNELAAYAEEFQISRPAPRSYLFAFSQKGWRSASALAKSLERAAAKAHSHLHGVVVLSENWHLVQEVYQTKPRYGHCTSNALLQFVTGLLHGLSSMPMGQCSINRYMSRADA